MSEAIYRDRQHVRQLFGDEVEMTGSIGTKDSPGHVALRCKGVTIGEGSNLRAAVTSSQRTLAAIGRRQHRANRGRKT